MTQKPVNPEVDFYDNLGIKYEEAFGHDPGLHIFINRSLARLSPKSSILELGSGTGKPTSTLIVESGHQLHGIDFSPVMVSLARSQVSSPAATFQEANILSFAPTGQYDAIFTVFSLFHLSREAINPLTRRWGGWVKPGGWIFVGTMAAEDFASAERATFAEDGLSASGVEHTFMGKRIGNLLFTRKGWSTLLEEGGFEVVETTLAPFQAPVEARCDVEPYWYIAAQKKK